MAERKITVKGEDQQARILAGALQLFNERGVEHVAVRDIARALDMRPGHLTYYFPDKESLVMELGRRMGAANDAAVPDGGVTTVEEFLDRFRAVMRNHIRYRGLVLHLGPLLRDMPTVRKAYATRQSSRQDGLRQALRAMVEHGALRPLTGQEEGYLVSLCSLIARGWVPETLASGYSLQKRVPHYLGLLEQAMAPFRGASARAMRRS